MAITSLDSLIAKLPGQQINMLKNNATTKGSGFFQSLWLNTGQPSAGAVPATVNGSNCDSSTLGCPKLTAPTTGLLYLAKLLATSSSTGGVIIYDRLWANAQLNATSILSQSWTAPTLTRAVTGESVEAWIEVYSALGGTAATATLTYTNSQGVTNRTATATITASMVAGQMTNFTLQSGDTGIRTCSSIILNASTGTAGNFGVTLLDRLATIPISSANSGNALDAFAIGMPLVETNAALSFMMLPSGTGTGIMLIDANIVEG